MTANEEANADARQAPAAGGGAEVLSADPIDGTAIADLSRSVERSTAGAVVLFLGNVRDHHQGRDVEAITYTAYESMARRRIRRIADELSQGDVTVAIRHRIGRLAVGATSVAIAASSPHRQEAYAASRQALERLKAEVPIWKREHYEDGDEAWREEEPL